MSLLGGTFCSNLVGRGTKTFYTTGVTHVPAQALNSGGQQKLQQQLQQQLQKQLQLLKQELQQQLQQQLQRRLQQQLRHQLHRR